MPEAVKEWLAAPEPRPAQRGKMISPGKPAKPGTYVPSGLFEAFRPFENFQANHASALARMIATSGISSLGDQLRSFGTFLPGVPGEPAKYAPDIPVEGFITHLIRLGWVESTTETGALATTPLGLALLRTAEAVESEHDGPTTVILGQDDELAYPTLIGRISEAEAGLLIDPYLRLEQLLAVRAYTRIARVLTSRSVSEKDLVAMAVLINSGGSENPIELRAAAKGILHDRMIVAASGGIDTVGTSLGTVGGKYTTVLSPLPEAVASEMRTKADFWWEQAEVLAVYPPAPPEVPPSVLGVEPGK